MTGVFLLALTFLIVFIGIKSSFQPLRLVSSFAWLIPIGYLTMTPPTLLTAGSPVQVIVIVICIGLLFIQLFWSFRKNLQIVSNTRDTNGNYKSVGEDSGGWHFPKFMNNGENEEQVIEKAREERLRRRSEYRNRFRRALNPDERND